MKKPKILTILMNFYSFKWLSTILSLPFRYVSFNVSKKFVTISYKTFNKNKKETKNNSLQKELKKKFPEKYSPPVDTLPEIKTYFVYILRSVTDKKYYIGTTDDLKGCLDRHNSGKNITTFDRIPFELIYYEAFINYFDAKTREKYLRSETGQRYLKKSLLSHFLQSKRQNNIKGVLKITSFVSTIILLLILPSVLAFLYSPRSTNATWFNESWLYRTPFTFTHNAALTDQQVQFTINTQTLITNGQLQSDCGDSRFTDYNGRLLAYYLVSGCNSTTTLYNVYIPVVNNGTNVVYHYYGNPSAANGTTTSPLPYTTLSPSGGSPTGGSEEKGPGPAAYWKFDEGYGQAVHDSVSKTNDATLGADSSSASDDPTWKTEDNCITGKCLYFDGSNDYVQDSGNINIANKSFSVSLWLKMTEINTDRAIIGQGVQTTDQGFVFGMRSTNVATFSFWGDDLDTTTTFEANRWYHFDLTYDATTNTKKIYVDGKLDSSGTAAGDYNNTGSFCIGGGCTPWGTNYFGGFIDDVKIYPYVRTANQVVTDYPSRGATKGVSVSIGNQETKFLNDRLVGYWKMDETSWNGTSGEVIDSTGNANNGTAQNGATTANGKFSFGGSFDGSNDQVTVPDNSTLEPSGDMTAATWVYFTSLPSTRGEGAVLIGKYDTVVNQESYFLEVNTSDTLRFSWRDSNGNNAVALSASSRFNAGTWYHVAGVKHDNLLDVYINGVLATNTQGKTSFNSIKNSDNTLRFGAAGASASRLFGLLDEVRIYNRGFNGNEIQQLFNWAPGPIGWWKLDENTGTTSIFDSSGNGNTGTLTAANSSDWVPGKYGSALNFDTTRKSKASLGNAAMLNNMNTLTAGVWLYPRSTGDSNEGRFFDKSSSTGPTNGWYFKFRSIGQALNFSVDYATQDLVYNTNETIPLNAWSYVSLTWDGNADPTGHVHMYINGVESTYSAGSALIGSGGRNSDASTPLKLGNYEGTSNYRTFDGFMDDARIYNYVRTNSQIIEDMNGGHPLGGSPIGSQLIYLKMDEQNGTTINNSGFGSSTYNGTATGTTWLENTRCKSNGCLNFDTSADNVSFGDVSFVDGIASMSASLWINPQQLAVDKSILSKNNASQRSFAIVTSPSSTTELRVHFAASTGEAANTTYCTTSGFGLAANTWQQIAVVYDGTNGTAANRVILYKNGKPVTCTMTGTFPPSMTSGSTSALKLGDDDSATYTSLISYMDDFKLYNVAITPDQVKIDYNAGASVNFNTGASPEASQSADTAGNAPVGYWNFNENTGSAAKDISGNSNDGTLQTMPTSPWTIGKIGSGLLFSGATPNIKINDSGTLRIGGSFSLSSWVYLNSLPGSNKVRYIIAKTGNDLLDTAGTDANYGLALNQGLSGAGQWITCAFEDSGHTDFGVSYNYSLPLNTWSHLECTFDEPTDTFKLYLNSQLVTSNGSITGIPATNNNDLYFGISNATSVSAVDEYFDGKIDEVKVYNYARTQSQVTYEYNRGAPIGWWKLDECQGTTSYDASGNGNNGTISIGSGGTQSAAGTCTDGDSTHAWYNGVNGKFNGSVKLDTTDDTISMGNVSMYSFERTQPFSLSAWINVSTANPYTIMSKQDSSAPFSGWNLQTSANGYFYFQIVNTYGSNFVEAYNATPITTYADGNWHMISATYDGSSSYTGVTMYYDGKPLTTTANPGAQTVSASIVNSINMYLGSRNGSAQKLPGSIDDARIYNYKLSASQIQKLYTDGSTVYFGPATGSP